MKKVFYMLFLFISVCTLFAGCSVETEEETADSSSEFYFYYINSDETKVESEIYAPEQETAEFMLQDLMQRLNNKAMEGEAINLLPKEVEMNSYKIEGTVLTIDFNTKYNDMSRAREILVRSGVVQTFLQIPGIDSVKFTVGGQELKDSKGNPVGEMTSSTFVVFSGADRDTYRYDTFTLYFTDQSGEHLVTEERRVGYRRSISRERVVLEQLAQGPREQGHYPTIPENTGITSVSVSDSICYVDFDTVFSDYALDIPEETVIYSVVNSLLAANEAQKVQISIGGDSEGNFGEDMSLYNFYEMNTALVAEEETASEPAASESAAEAE